MGSSSRQTRSPQSRLGTDLPQVVQRLLADVDSFCLGSDFNDLLEEKDYDQQQPASSAPFIKCFKRDLVPYVLSRTNNAKEAQTSGGAESWPPPGAAGLAHLGAQDTPQPL